MGQTGITPPRPKSSRWLWWSLGGLFLAIFSFRMGTWSSGATEGGGMGEKVGIITIEGLIYSSDKIVKNLDKFLERKDIKAIVLRINSAGGMVAPTQEIFEKVKKVRKVKPIISSLGSVAASGGYYIAIAGDSILANGGTILGSIGVIMEYPVVEKLLDKIGIAFQTIKSGELKDTGSSTRKPTEKDVKYLQEVVDDLFDQFVTAVSVERSMSREKVKALADGRVFTGVQSLELGLVDRLGTFEDAIALAGKLGNITGKPKTVRVKKKRPSFLDWFMGEMGQKISARVENIPTFRWYVE